MKPPILFLNLFPSDQWGGGEVHAFQFYKAFKEQHYPMHIFVPHKHHFTQKLKQANLPYVYSKLASLVPRQIRLLYKIAHTIGIYNFCKKNNIQIIHCNNAPELPIALFIAKLLNVKISYVRHVHNPIKPNKIKGVAGLVGVSPVIAGQLGQLNIQHSLGIKEITFIPPVFDSRRVQDFQPNTHITKESFFEQTFSIKIHGCPIACMIANMYRHVDHKNHPLLFQAVHKLVHEKKKPLEIMLAGEGPNRNIYKSMVKKLNISEYVHFLGFTKEIPALLNYSDISVLTSSNEAFGIVHIEAAFMKKPIICAQKTGGETIVKHNQTGLLFKNNDVNDLVEKLEMLIDSPELRKTLGQNVYNIVKDDYTQKALIDRYKRFFEKIQT